MKKILFAIAIVLTISLSANAQRKDGFFNNSYDNVNRGDADPTDAGLGLPNNYGLVTGGLYGEDQDAPLGTGLLILTALGAGYAVARKKK